MNRSTSRAGWRECLTGVALVALLVAASTALGMGNLPASGTADGTEGAETAPAQSTGRVLGLPEKPPSLDEAGWNSLQQAVRKAASQQAKLSAGSVAGADGSAGDFLGISVALDGDTALVGSLRDDVGANTDQGSAYVFARSGTIWTLQAKLTAGDGASFDEFGRSVALDGNTAVVGAGSGEAYVFARVGVDWTLQEKLAASDGTAGDLFGWSVAIEGDTILVGAYLSDLVANNNQGAAYVFARSGSTWTEQAKLTASDGAANDSFGVSVALSGDTALVGAFSDDVGSNADQGSAYVFTRMGATWTQQQKLTGAGGAAFDRFGLAVALDGDTALLGAYQDDVGANTDQGSAFIFVRSGTTWTQQAQLTSADGASVDQFGYSVALDGDTALVGSNLDDISAVDQGSAYVFTRSGTAWTQQQKLVTGVVTGSANFGWSVALGGDTVAIGAPFAVVGPNANQGSAYVFTRSGTTWTQQAQLTAGDGAADDQFGWSVALDGDTALVGAFFDDLGATANQGSAYVFMRSGATWTLQARLTAADGAASDEFGRSVALHGDTALVGSRLDDVGVNTDQGSAYVFTRSGATWTQQAKLTAGDGAASDWFGWSVALDGDIALVGANADAIGANLNQGSAYVFTRSGTTWTQQTKLTAGDGAVNDQFGFSVALDGDTALVGAAVDDVGANGNQGSAYVFIRSGSIWAQQAQLTAGDGAANDQFGFSVALDGDTALAGARFDDIGVNGDQGSAYVFTRSGTVWTQQAQLRAGDGAPSDFFGYSVALDFDTVLVGAVFDDVGANGDQGSAYVFTRSGTTWTQQAKLTVGDGALNDAFGRSVALSNGTAVVGAEQVDGLPPFGNPNQGAAYVFSGVGLQPQTITFANPGPQVFGTAPTLTATASSGLPVSFSSASTDVCTISAGGTLSFLTTGTCTINANQAGDGTYDAAPQVSQSFAVINAPIDAVNDSGTVANGASGGVAVADVLLNDTLNAAAATQASVALTQLSTSNPNITLNPATGAVAVAAATPAGTYTLSYEICEQLNPTNCDTAIATVTVGAAVIDAVNDSGTVANGASGGIAVADVLLNDTLNAAAATQASVTLTQLSTSNPNITLNPATGAVAVAAATPAGTYTLTYQICEQLNPTNCDNATATVTVGAAPIDAVDEDYTGTQVNGASGGTLPTVLVNDTLNGGAATVGDGGNVTLTPSAAPTPAAGSIAMNADGTITIAAGTTAGVYTYAYTICEVLNPTNCDTATVTVNVGAALIDAVDDSGTVPNGALGGTAVANVLVNDTLNNAPATLASVTLTQLSTSNPNITLNPATGAVAVAAATPAGTYTLTYRICEQLNPTNCDTAAATVTVGAAVIDAVDDSGTVPNGASGGVAVADVLLNDTLNAAPATLASVTLTQLSTSNPNITLNPATGAVAVAAATPAGTYTLTYRICEQLNPTNCDTAPATVTVVRADQAALTATASPSSISFGGISTLATTGGSGSGAVSYAVTVGSEFCSISGTTLTGTGVGTCTVTATKAADDNFNAVTATVEVTVGRAEQAVLTATASPSSIAFGATSTLATTGGSGAGAVSFAVIAGGQFCSISGTTLTGTGVGTCIVTATKAADDNFNAASATVEVTVVRAEQAALTATASPSSIAFGGTSTLGMTGGSGMGAVSYAVTAGTEFCSISGTTLTGTGVGTCTVTATKAADANFNAAFATVEVTVGRAEQAALTATASPSSIAFGGTSTLGTTGGSGTGAVSYAISAGGEFCSISGTTLTGTGVGTCTVTATKAADANFNAATATVSVTVARANQAPLSVTATPSAIPLTRTTALAATGGSGSGEVSFAVTAGAANCTISGSTLTGTGVGACTVTATKAGDAQFNPATAQATVVVQAATDLEISKDDGTQYSVPDGSVQYEILVANAGPLDVEGARLRDVLPAGLADALWTCTPLQLASCPQAAGEGGIDQTLTLPVNGVLRYLLSARVTAPLGSTLTNTATIDAPTGVIELQPADNSASDSNLVVPEGLFGNGFEAAPNRISVPVKGR